MCHDIETHFVVIPVLFKGGRFMSNTMFDAREALVPGGVYDRRIPHMEPANPYENYFRTHDRLSYIGAERAIPPAAAASIPVPVGMFIPPVPPPHHSFFNPVS